MASRKTLGLDIDIQRIAGDRDYALQVLGKASACDDESLVLAAITLQDKLGLLAPRPAAPDPSPKAGSDDKYKYGARS
jgi:hypothetical protein